LDFSWTADQTQLKDAIVQFARQELDNRPDQASEGAGFDRDGWRACGEFDIQGLPIPRQYGGGELDALTAVYALEGLGCGCRVNGLIFSINAHTWSCGQPILTYGT
jgi:alkylation response protein AidB-like acyl-CoA dehydrogenase